MFMKVSIKQSFIWSVDLNELFCWFWYIYILIQTLLYHHLWVEWIRLNLSQPVLFYRSILTQWFFIWQKCKNLRRSLMLFNLLELLLSNVKLKDLSSVESKLVLYLSSLWFIYHSLIFASIYFLFVCGYAFIVNKAVLHLWSFWLIEFYYIEFILACIC